MTIRKREYFYLLIIVFHFIIFHLFRWYLIILDEQIRNKIDVLYSTFKNPTEQQYLPLSNAKDQLSVYFSLLIIISSLLIMSILLSSIKIQRKYSFGKNKEKKLIGGVIAGFSSYYNVNSIVCRVLFVIILPLVFPLFVYIFLWGLLPNTNYKTTNKKNVVIDNNGFLFVPFLFIYVVCCFNDVFNYDIQDKYLMSYFIFIPYLYIIYDKIIIGKQIDITQEVISEREMFYNESVDELNKLLEMGLLSQEEYQIKKESRTQEKARIEIKDTEEYSLLIKAKQKRHITEEEFDNKVERLVNKKINNE